MNYGIKVVKSGKDISTTDVRDVLMSSQYSMLKYHMDDSDTVSFTSGETHKYVDFTHNLGYVPAFIAYYEDPSGIQYVVPSLPRSGGYDGYGYGWADTEKVRVGYVLSSDYNTVYRSTFDYVHNTTDVNPYAAVGNVTGSGRDTRVEYHDMELSQGQSIYAAHLDFVVNDRGGTDNVLMKTTGIDEDNPSENSDDMGRPETSAVETQSVSVSSGETFGINVKDQIQEIVNRGGWASGHNLAFYMRDNSSPASTYVSTYTGNVIKLYVYLPYSFNVSFRVIIFKDKIA